MKSKQLKQIWLCLNSLRVTVKSLIKSYVIIFLLCISGWGSLRRGVLIPKSPPASYGLGRPGLVLRPELSYFCPYALCIMCISIQCKI